MAQSRPTVAAVGSIRTADVEFSDRLEYWENYNTTALVGLRCTTYASEGLAAEQTNFDVGEIKLADIRGNAHVIERTPQLVATHPKESVFASLLIEGSAFFYSADGCVPVRAGEVVVYNTVNPYLFAFGTTMRQILVDVPREALIARFGAAEIERPIVGDPRIKGAGILADLLGDARGGAGGLDLCTAATLLDAVGAVSGLDGDLSSARMVQARTFVESAISDPDLTAEDVARAVGVTLRHLNRAFADSGTSVSRMIREQRLERAVEDLRASSASSIADIAVKWGFSSHAQFATLVRTRFGSTPSELRRQP